MNVRAKTKIMIFFIVIIEAIVILSICFLFLVDDKENDRELMNVAESENNTKTSNS